MKEEKRWIQERVHRELYHSNVSFLQRFTVLFLASLIVLFFICLYIWSSYFITYVEIPPKKTKKKKLILHSLITPPTKDTGSY